MPDITPTIGPVSASIRSAEWAAVTSADPAIPYRPPYVMSAVATVQISGTFGGATVTFEGSNDGVTYFPLKDMSGVEISLTAAGLVDFSTGALFVKPVVTGGTAESINVILAVRG